jgi:hypothetical protein
MPAMHQWQFRMWIIALISLVLLLIEAVVTTFFLMIALNGLPSIPDALVNSYLVCTCGLLPILGLLSGFLAKQISGWTAVPLWGSGLITTVIGLAIMPIALFVLAFGLLAAFGKL